MFDLKDINFYFFLKLNYKNFMLFFFEKNIFLYLFFSNNLWIWEEERDGVGKLGSDAII